MAPNCAPIALVVTRFCRSSASFRMLDAHPDTAGGTWSMGGCYVLAEALARAFGWARYGITSEVAPHGHSRQLQHVVVGRSGRYLDADGLSSAPELLATWREREGLQNPLIVPLTKDIVLGSEIPCPPEVVARVEEALLRAAARPRRSAGLRRRRNGETATLPEWLDDPDIDDPLGTYDDDKEGGDVPDEETLLALMVLQKKRRPQTTYKKNTYPTGMELYVVQEPGRRSWDDPTVFVYERSEKDGSFSREEGNRFLERLSMHDSWWEWLGDSDESFNEDFWDSPTLVFHGTPDIEGVLKSGLRASSESRGMTNQSVGDAVFATMDQDLASVYAHGSGGGIVVIDTKAMKRDGFMPRVTQEPGIVEHEQSMAMAQSIGLHWETSDSSSDGVTPDTVIFHRGIPKKYLRRLK